MECVRENNNGTSLFHSCTQIQTHTHVHITENTEAKKRHIVGIMVVWLLKITQIVQHVTHVNADSKAVCEQHNRGIF